MTNIYTKIEQLLTNNIVSTYHIVWKVKITTKLENIDPPSVDSSTYGYELKAIYNNDNNTVSKYSNDKK